MKTSATTTAVVASMLFAHAQLASAQTADQVVERYLTAIGGRAALEKLKSRSATGTITFETPAGNVTGSIEILNAAPNKARTLVKADFSSLGAGPLVLDQRFDGYSGYILDSLQGNREMTGNQLDNMRNGGFPNPLLNYKSMGATVQLSGKEKVADREAHVLVVEPVSGSTIRYYIDAETYLPIKMMIKVHVPQVGQEVEQTNEFSDYRDVDGVKIPFQLKSSSAIQRFTMTFTKVEHNVAIDAALFSKPPAK